MALAIKPFWHSKLSVLVLQPLKLTVPFVSSPGYILFPGKATQRICIDFALFMTKQKVQGMTTIMILWWICFYPALVTVDMSTTL